MSRSGKPSGRYAGLDCLKLLAAFLVVCAHIRFPSPMGAPTLALARCTVPVFFLISGFFFRRERAPSQLKKTLLLVVGSSLFYVLLNLFLYQMQTGDPAAYLVSLGKKFRSSTSLFHMFVLNESPFAAHLWYLNALLYGLAVIWLLDRRGKLHWALYLTPFLLTVDVLLGRYSILIFNRELSSYLWLRNFLFVAVPHLTIGIYLKKTVDHWSRVPKIIYLFGAVLAAACTLIEFGVLSWLEAAAQREQYVSSTPLAVCLFCFFYLLPAPGSNRLYSLLAWLGRECSTFLYIAHWGVIQLIRLYQDQMPGPLYTCWKNLGPVLAFCATLTLAILWTGGKRLCARNITKSS